MPVAAGTLRLAHPSFIESWTGSGCIFDFLLLLLLLLLLMFLPALPRSIRRRITASILLPLRHIRFKMHRRRFRRIGDLHVLLLTAGLAVCPPDHRDEHHRRRRADDRNSPATARGIRLRHPLHPCR